LGRALSDVLQRLEGRAPTAWQARFRRDLTISLDGHERENAFRRTKRIPPVAGFPAMRRDASFCYPLFDLFELCRDAPVPTVVYGSRPYRMIRDAIADIMCWTNDVHSLHMELAVGEPINHVIVLRQADNCTLGEAVDEVCRRIGERVEDFLAAGPELSALLTELSAPSRVRHSVFSCVSGFASWAGRMEEWDRTGTNRFDPTTIGTSGLPLYVQDLLPRQQGEPRLDDLGPAGG
jgi:hypothetical protein